MKYLLLLRGIPASGKSTFIEKNHLTPYTVSSDAIRLLFQSPVLDEPTATLIISQKNDRRVWEFLYQRVEEKMSRGEFIVIDAMNINVSNWKKLVEKYDYKAFVYQFNESVDTCIKRNKLREEYKRVPQEVIRSAYDRMMSTDVPRWCKVINSLDEITAIEPFDMSHYDKMVFFGDIHGCLEPLANYFKANPFSENTLYVFVGDYVDRGIQNKETLEYLIALSRNRNVKFLEGNHKWERLYANDEISKIRSREFLDNTLPAIHDIDKKDLRHFCNKWIDCLYIGFHNVKYFVTHAGISRFPITLAFMSSDEMIHGGKYENDVDKWYEENYNGITQIHGHRNLFGHTAMAYPHSINLNDSVEFGAPLRILEIGYADNLVTSKVVLMENHTFTDKPNTWDERKQNLCKDEFVIKLRNSGDIIEKDLGNDISSFNFKRDVFFKDKWNELNKIARGLFINVDNGKIVARSYPKFFNVFEENKNSEAFLRTNLKFPVTAYCKYNGFLGILSVNDSDFFFASKSTIHSEFAGWFKEIFNKFLTAHDRDEIFKYLKIHDCSFVFEVIDPVNDPHIIEYDKAKIVLLDVIDNKREFVKLKYDDLVLVAKRLRLEVKKIDYIFDNADNMMDFIKSDDHPEVEGWVFEDSNGYMFKYKTPYYLLWKNRRRYLERIQGGKSINYGGLNEEDRKFAEFVEMNCKKFAMSSIIDVRKEYLKCNLME